MAANVTATVFELVKNPDHLDRLRQELAPFVTAGRRLQYDRIQQLDHLNGVINQVMRLHCSVPTATFRLTLPKASRLATVLCLETRPSGACRPRAYNAKNLSLQHIRNTMVELITRFDFALGPSNDMALFEDGQWDGIGMKHRQLRLVLSGRGADG
ncbi:hypothetical protein HIM_05853 [Hirsutella minnesotensis 3608]|uniref:Uncharacterized protein n=1 Tax=Hirsutella minnesotensis 3608 TaxID=1043627 RepID=A0A0F7ZJW3_9HYPO|nr:hypothetical protein HIM_05853 [Hirsutella minnesotensis 3608]